MGFWVFNLRQKEKQLTPEQVTRLESLADWVWSVSEFQWEEGFSCLETFVEQKGHAQVPRNYKTEDGYKLGGWVEKQRTRKERLTPEKIKRLDLLEEWVWSVLEFQWEQMFSYLQAFVEREGHASVPRSYKTEDGYSLGNWVINHRRRKNQLTPEQIIRLESLEGWVWNSREFKWEQGFSYLQEFVEKGGHARVPQSYKTEDGYQLGAWVNTKRVDKKKNKLTPEQITRLESLDGWVWDVSEFRWVQGFSYIKAYVEQEGHSRVPRGYKTENGYRLGNWINKQRAKKDQLTPERIQRLDALGFVWDPLIEQWEQGFSELTIFKDEHLHCLVHAHHKTASGFALGVWARRQRTAYRKDQLTPERITRLESLKGWVWSLK